MATVEERLIGFQLVRSTNRMTRNTLELSAVLKGFNKWKTVESVRETVNLAEQFVTSETAKIEQFLSRYPDAKQVDRGLSYHNTVKRQIEDDKVNLREVNTTAKQAAELAASMENLSTVGNALLSSVQENTTEIVTYEDHFKDIHLYVSIWDLVNATAIVLQGKTHGTGKPIETLEERIQRAAAHVQTFFRLSPLVEDSASKQAMITAMREVESQLSRARTVEQTDRLGADVDLAVPRLPLLRRWWQYGD